MRTHDVRATMLRCTDAHPRDIVNQQRPDQVALALVRLQQLGALVLRILHQAFDEVRAALADHWRDRGIVLQSKQMH